MRVSRDAKYSGSIRFTYVYFSFRKPYLVQSNSQIDEDVAHLRCINMRRAWNRILVSIQLWRRQRKDFCETEPDGLSVIYSICVACSLRSIALAAHLSCLIEGPSFSELSSQLSSLETLAVYPEAFVHHERSSSLLHGNEACEDHGGSVIRSSTFAPRGCESSRLLSK